MNPRFQVGDRVRWCFQMAEGVSTHGVVEDKWGTVVKVVPTGLPAVQMPGNITVEPFLYYVQWDYMDEGELGNPMTGNMLENKSAVERLGDIDTDDV